jgi:hypothetical protein
LKDKMIRVTLEGRLLLARLRIVNGIRMQHGEAQLVAGKLAEDGLRPAIEAEERRWGIEPTKEEGNAD